MELGATQRTAHSPALANGIAAPAVFHPIRNKSPPLAPPLLSPPLCFPFGSTELDRAESPFWQLRGRQPLEEGLSRAAQSERAEARISSCDWLARQLAAPSTPAPTPPPNPGRHGGGAGGGGPR